MKLEELTNLIKDIPGGTYVRITYVSTPPLTAKAKSDGWEISKVTQETGRFADYGNVKTVVERRGTADTAANKNMWYHDYLPNRIVKHNTRDDYYMSYIRDDKSSHANYKYFLVNNKTGATFRIDGDSGMKDMGIVQNGYWRKDEADEIKMVNTMHIIDIKNKNNNNN